MNCPICKVISGENVEMQKELIPIDSYAPEISNGHMQIEVYCWVCGNCDHTEDCED